MVKDEISTWKEWVCGNVGRSGVGRRGIPDEGGEAENTESIDLFMDTPVMTVGRKWDELSVYGCCG